MSAGTERFCDLEVSTSSLQEIVRDLTGPLTTGRRRKVIMCLNPHSFVVSRKDGLFRRALQSADYLLPDGTGIITASRILGGSVKGRIAGFDIFMSLSEEYNCRGSKSFYFLGGSEDTLGKIRSMMKKRFPNIGIAGTYSPPFRELTEEENRQIVMRINDSRPTVLWVSMTAPKQEKWIYEHADRLDTDIIGAIGAAFDFFAGTKKRAPHFLMRMNLEWLGRLAMEPRRMWKRTFISAPLFLFYVIRDRFRRGKFLLSDK